ncbi:murein hydrolase activator EnvC family protein [Serpentinicella alkaliphila]|uniref:Peptidase M23-like protein n=1 Tax=Serpentinicella alkaliphila TaxID=1734049 RepID=A0A4R2T8U8_9FIRM|nr:M23 family metallopeptidase [Serpentinicella alkaliphila]QUH26067.1 M23 family metallopeptidase [Serpentinicella alkaliphila]TCP99080.1 peptidase M23-like protein [Serpentinicella alkaliphila]
MNYTRNQKFRGFQTSNEKNFFEFDLDPKSIAKKLFYKSIICAVILAVLFSMKVINRSGTNHVLNFINTQVNSKFEYGYYWTKVNGFPQYVFKQGQKAAEVINIPTFNTMQFVMPVQGEIVSFFDQSTTSAQTNTKGIIISTEKNDKISASHDGTVMETGFTDNIGNYVIIKHKGNMLTIYKYLEESLVKNNQAVKQGDVIGLATNKLQFEMWDRNSPVDPLRYLDLK